MYDDVTISLQKAIKKERVEPEVAAKKNAAKKRKSVCNKVCVNQAFPKSPISPPGGDCRRPRGENWYYILIKPAKGANL